MAGLSKDRVLDAALALVDRDGLAGLSMRKLGAELGVEAMTLYYYVPNKGAVLDGVVERVLAAATVSPVGPGWQDWFREFAVALRAALLRHPHVLPLLVSRPITTPDSLRAIEQGIRALRAAGFPLGRAFDVLNAVAVFTLGHASAEVGVTGSQDAGTDWTAFLDDLDPAEFPLVTEAARTGAGVDDEERFHFALDALLVGFAAVTPQVSSPGPATAAPGYVG